MTKALDELTERWKREAEDAMEKATPGVMQQAVVRWYVLKWVLEIEEAMNE